MAFRTLVQVMRDLLFPMKQKATFRPLVPETWSIAEAERQLHSLAHDLGFTHLPDADYGGSMGSWGMKFRKGELEIWGGHERSVSYVVLKTIAWEGRRREYSPEIIVAYANGSPLAADNMNPESMDALRNFLPPLIEELEGPHRLEAMEKLDRLCLSRAERLFGPIKKSGGS